MKRIIGLIVIVLWVATAYAQLPKCTFTHYSSDEGLSQKTVMHILEDHHGFMWFSTWNGLSKFDGYDFTNYKASKDNLLNLTNNRIDFMDEDRFGFIWVLTYDDFVYRFDTQKEIFAPVNCKAKTRQLKILPNGDVWMFLKNGAAVRVSTDTRDYSMSFKGFSNRDKKIRANRINDVFLDHANREWILTNQGLYVLNNGSSVPISCLAENKDAFFAVMENVPFISFGSVQGKMLLFEKSAKRFRYIQFNTSSDIVFIKWLNSNKCFVATRNDGFFIYYPSSGVKVHYTTRNAPALANNQIYHVYVDRQGEVWIDQQVEGCVVHFNSRANTLKREQMKVDREPIPSSYPPFQILEDRNGRLWVHPFGGGFSLFDRAGNRLVPFYNQTGSSDWRFSNKLHAMISDRQGNLWISTHSKGLEKICFVKNFFHNKSLINQNYESSSNDVRSIFVEKERHRIWYGTRDGSVRIYSMDTGQYIGSLDENGHLSTNLSANIGAPAYHMMKDSRGRIWIATKGQGLVKLENEHGGHFQLTHYKHVAGDVFSISNNNVYDVHEDSYHRIWVATYGGGINCIQENADGTMRFVNCYNLLKNWPGECMRVRMMTSDGYGNIWAGTTNGAVCFHSGFSNPAGIRFYRYCRQAGNAYSLSDNDVYWIIHTSANQIFLATFGGGLDKLVKRDGQGNAVFKTYTTGNGLLNNVLLSIQEDKHKNLWISSENGLTKFNPRTERMEMYDNSHFNARADFNEGACANIDKGVLLFGCSNGISYFVPDSIHKSAYVPSIVLSKLSVLQKLVQPSIHNSILHRSLNNTAEITLKHKQNFFSIQYAALDMTNPDNIQYAYKLEGFDKDWNYVRESRTAVYTNIPKGEYVFRVKSTNSDGVWVNNERTLRIRVLPSFWERPIAFLLYVLFFFLITFITVYTILKFARLKQKVQMEKEISDLKLRFFTNISHELRTPLTLISGPVEQVLQNPSLSAENRAQLDVVKRNSDRMLHFVNQILDFRKVQNKKMKLSVQQIEVVSFARHVMDNFNQIAIEHQIDYVFEPEKPELYLWADANKLEIIIFNLLSNAFKYTPSGRMIGVFIAEDEHTISIGVHDQGIGISERERKSLFVRFENLVDKKMFTQSSTGIGLSLVKEFADMHKATIDVDSALDKGSLFTVNFLKGKDHYDESVEFILDDDKQSESVETTAVPDDMENIKESAEKPLMLIVEDNVELRTFLRSIFTEKFRIVEAGDGVEGLTKALRFVPDFIISDVIMPQKDGIEMTKDLRGNLITSHIPIIILTAKTTIDDKLEGLEGGADSYITKPFSSTYLQARVDNILSQRRNLQNLYRRQMVSDEADPHGQTKKKEENGESEYTELSPNDRKFMSKLMELMESNMDNGELMVDELARELALSRSVFFKKLKALTGLAPIEFIREIRINRAAKLIEEGEWSMIEIAEKVGINDSRYFSKCFKHQFGITPTEYRDKMKNLS